jgi:hypothetical protein
VEVINDGGANSQVNVFYDSANRSSVIELFTVLTYIDVGWVKLYNETGIQTSNFAAGKTIDIRAYVSDPFGVYDIAKVNATVYYPNGTAISGLRDVNLTIYQTDPLTPTAWRIYNKTVLLPVDSPVGNYTVNVTGVEGNNVTNSRIIPFYLLPNVSIEPDTWKGGVPGQTVNFSNIVTNTGDGVELFGIYAYSEHGWTVKLYNDTNKNGILDAGEPLLTDTDGDGRVDTGYIGVGTTYYLVVQVTVPAGVINITDNTTITATSKFSPSVLDTAIDTVQIPEYQTILVPLIIIAIVCLTYISKKNMKK